MTSKRGSLETSIIVVCPTSRLLDLSLMQINLVSSISRGRKELLQADLVRPSSNDVGCAQKLVRRRWMPLYFNRDEQQIAEGNARQCIGAILRISHGQHC
jgi:hypothetical protein